MCGSRYPRYLPLAVSSVLAGTQHAEPSYPHAVALEDIVPVERWGVQRVYGRWILHRAGERGRAGTQTLRDLFRRSKEAPGTGTRQEGGQLAATNTSTKKRYKSSMGETGLALQELIKNKVWAFHWPRLGDTAERHTRLSARSQHRHGGLSSIQQPSL